MVEQTDSFFSLKEDLALNKRPSPEQGSNRPPKRRTVDHEGAAGSFFHTSDETKLGNDTALSDFDTLAIRDRNMDAPSTAKHASRGSFSLPRRASHHTRNGTISRRLSEAQDNIKAATSKAKDWYSNAFSNTNKTEQKSFAVPTAQSTTRSRTNSISWGSRRLSRPTIQPDTFQGPIAPQRTSSLEQSSFGPPLARAPTQNLLPSWNGSCASHPAHYGFSAGVEDVSSRRSGHFSALRGGSDMEVDPIRQDRMPRLNNRDFSQRRAIGFNSLRRSESDNESGIDMDGGPSRPTLKMYSRLGTPRGPRIDPASLPPEIILNVFKHLSMPSLATSHLVSRRWNELASDFSVQKHRFLSTWQPPTMQSPLPAPVGGGGLGKSRATCSDAMQDWKTMYRARKHLEHNWRRGKEKTTYLFSHTDSVYCVQFDEHKAITGSRDQTIRVWDLHTMKCIKVIGCARDAYSKDRLKSPMAGELTTEMEDQIRKTGHANYYPTEDVYHQPRYWHQASILCLQYDDDVLITGSSDHTLIMWDMHTFQPIRRLERHTSGVLDLAFDNDKIVSCSKDYSICIWDRRTGEMLHQIHDHQGPVNAIQLRNDTIVSASGEGSAHLYKLNYKRRPGRRPGDPAVASCKPVLWKTFWSKDRGLACIEYSDDGQYVFAGGNDHLIFKYDTTAEATTAPIQQSWRGHDGLVRSLYLDPSNRRTISGSYDLSIRVWDYETGRCMRHYQEKTTSWILSAKSDYRRLVATSQDGRVVVLDFGGDVKGVECLQGTDKPEMLVPKTPAIRKPGSIAGLARGILNA